MNEFTLLMAPSSHMDDQVANTHNEVVQDTNLHFYESWVFCASLVAQSLSRFTPTNYSKCWQCTAPFRMGKRSKLRIKAEIAADNDGSLYHCY
jgi:hypothetical protein